MLIWKWRNGDGDSELLSDIYDGKIWKEFQSIDGKKFLSRPNNLALGLGCDWFQPYKYVTYSVGVLFNLPSEERFKMENIILLGIIPGPSEPKKPMNSYLGPFVQDLFWEGVAIWLNHHNHTNGIELRHVQYTSNTKGMWVCWTQCSAQMLQVL